MVTERLTTRGLRCRWETDTMVIELPGWVALLPVFEAIQPSLFSCDFLENLPESQV